MAANENPAEMSNGRTATQPKIEWDTSQMKSSYANVCNVSSTREEVILLFGMNETIAANQEKVSIQLNNRVIISPFAAKRMHELLGKALNEYEAAFGPLPETPKRQ